VAKVNAAGKITAIYHDPSVSSIPQILVSSGGESATAVMSRGGLPKFQVTLDANCKVVAEKPFILYGDFPAPVRPIDNGYEMITSVYNPTPNGPEALGYFDIKMDKYLNVLSSVKVFPDAATRREVYSAINYNNKGYFCIAPATNYSSGLDWLYTDGNGAVTILPDENKTDYLPDAFTRDLVKVEGETLNMMVRHYGVYEQNFTFDGKDYTTPSNLHFSYFWVKYLHEDPEPCKRISATVTQSGLEGSKDVSIKYSLLTDCPAEDDIVIHLTDADPQLNQGDFTLPATVTISKGQTSTTLTIPVTNDNLMEEQESFTLKAAIPDNPLGYTISGAAAGTLFYIDDDDNTDDNRKFKVTYTPRVTEGSSGKIKVALLGTALLSQPLSFMLNENPPAFAATAGFDYTPFALTIPAGQREIEIDLNTLTDQLIEGDEFIRGNITTGGNTLGQFTSTENTVAITILDADNTVANRVIAITPATDVLNEGSSITYSFQLPAGIGVQYALDINAQLLKWFTYLQATGITGLQISYTNKKPQLTITYPDDNIIRIDDVASILLSAVDSHAGAYRFKWKGVITNELVINPVDNDKNFYLELSPSYQTVNEGQSGNITMQLSNGLTLTDDIKINYQWGGTDVAADRRVQVKQGNVVLGKGQRSVALPFDILDDDLVNVYNERNISFAATSTMFGPVAFQPSSTAAVDILNNDYLELTIPNTFTPNGDGVNDKWLIAGLDSDPKSKMNVFNRYGAVVFSSVGYAKPWDGTMNGKELPVGVYYYTIYFDGKKYSGNITLLR
jgi:gliding motility-associated-like protein